MNTLKKLRELNNLKQEELASVLNISLSNYCKKENGLIKVSLLEANKIANLFNMKIEDIFLKVRFR